MMGLEQIKEVNENPTEFAKSRMSDGQRRRNDDAGKAFWSQMEEKAKAGVDPLGIKNLSTAAEHGRSRTDWARVDAMTDKDIDAAIASDPDAATTGEVQTVFKRAQGEHPLPGGNHPFVPPVADQRSRYIGLKSDLPDIYSDARGLNQAILEVMGDFNAQRDNLRDAMRNFRNNPTHEMQGQLQIVYDSIATPDLRVRALVNQLVTTIDGIAPEPVGYTPHMGINYALAPVKKLVKSIREALSV